MSNQTREKSGIEQAENIRFYLKRSARKTVSVEVQPDLSVLVRAPLRMSMKDIRSFIGDSRDWIENHLDKAKARQEAAGQAEKLTMEEIRHLAREASKDIPARAEHYASLLGVTYGRITIRNQKSRWGSCSAKKNLNFNCLLMLMPPEHRDYVVVHELCHLKEMNHSRRFWSEVESILPDYKKSVKWLRENGESLMARMV